jgi:hypothetical protein
MTSIAGPRESPLRDFGHPRRAPRPSLSTSARIYSWIQTKRLSARNFPTIFQRRWMPCLRSLPTMDGRGPMPPHPPLLRATLSREASGSVQSHTRGKQQGLLRMLVQGEMAEKGRTRSRPHWRASAAAWASCLTRPRQRGPLEQGHSPRPQAPSPKTLRQRGPIELGHSAGWSTRHADGSISSFRGCHRADWRPMRDSEGAVLRWLPPPWYRQTTTGTGRCVCMMDQFSRLPDLIWCR